MPLPHPVLVLALIQPGCRSQSLIWHYRACPAGLPTLRSSTCTLCGDVLPSLPLPRLHFVSRLALSPFPGPKGQGSPPDCLQCPRWSLSGSGGWGWVDGGGGRYTTSLVCCSPMGPDGPWSLTATVLSLLWWGDVIVLPALLHAMYFILPFSHMPLGKNRCIGPQGPTMGALEVLCRRVRFCVPCRDKVLPWVAPCLPVWTVSSSIDSLFDCIPTGHVACPSVAHPGGTRTLCYYSEWLPAGVPYLLLSTTFYES